MRRGASPIAVALSVVLLAGCEGVQSALDPAGHQSGRIAGLWWLFLGVLATVYLLVLAGLLVAAARPRHRGRLPDGPGIAQVFAKEKPIERRLARGLTAWAVGTGIIILTLTGLSSACVMCHTIHGTSAASRVGPDLTHVAGRLLLAAGTLPYNKGNLAGWIADPQRIKPGTQMPITGLSPDQLQSVVAYLDSLK